MKRLACVLLALAATQVAVAQEDQREGKVYRCEKDGTRYYRTTPMEGVECAAISYHYKDSPGATAQPGASSDWKLITVSAEGSLYYFRPKDLRRTGSQVTFWLLSDHATSQVESQVGTYQSSVARTVIDCAERAYHATQTTYYSERYGKGNVVRTLSPMGNFLTYATPETVGETWVETMCSASGPRAKAP